MHRRTCASRALLSNHAASCRAQKTSASSASSARCVSAVTRGFVCTSTTTTRRRMTLAVFGLRVLSAQCATRQQICSLLISSSMLSGKTEISIPSSWALSATQSPAQRGLPMPIRKKMREWHLHPWHLTGSLSPTAARDHDCPTTSCGLTKQCHDRLSLTS
uniref:Uncharacterized protein n=1 Tax=Ixodes ricinus TaxID=34613 RepID=A0A147BBK3_IXORI